MILHTEPFFDNTRIEVVDGDDIMLSYKNNSKVSSCMSIKGRWERQKFWSYVPRCNLIRVMDDNDVLLLRALLWNAIDQNTGNIVKYLDKIYHKGYPYDGASISEKPVSHPDVLDNFEKVWRNFAHTRTSFDRLVVEVLPVTLKEYPMTDTFRFFYDNHSKLSNRVPLDFKYQTLSDHRMGMLMAY